MTQCFDSVVTRSENTYENLVLALAVSEQKVIRKWNKTEDLDMQYS